MFRLSFLGRPIEFDWSCIERMEQLGGPSDLVWKAAKPLLQVYVPLKATKASGGPRERVQHVQWTAKGEGQGAGESTRGQTQRQQTLATPGTTREDRVNQGELQQNAQQCACNELARPCFYYVLHCRHGQGPPSSTPL